MDKWIFLIVLYGIQYGRCEKFDVFPSSDSACPDDSARAPCLTLQQFAAYSGHSSNITLELQPGHHFLESVLSVVNISTFIMRGTAGNVSLSCRNVEGYNFRFSQLQLIQISGITFSNCLMELSHVVNAGFLRNSFANQTKSGTALQVETISVLNIMECRFYNNVKPVGDIISASAVSNVTISRSVFDNNSGGVVRLQNSGTVNIHESNFSNNIAASSGNGAVCVTGREVSIVHALFYNNTQHDNGGAICIFSAEVTIIDSIFANNTAENHGGAVYASGDNITIVNTNFRHNMARSLEGGAIYIHGGGLTATHSAFANNRAGRHGGAIYVSGGNVAVNGTYFSGNSAITGSGGAIYCGRSSYSLTAISLANNTFTNNSASSGGGGALYSGSHSLTISLMHSTFTSNMAAYCGVLDIDEFRYPSVYLIGSAFNFNMAQGQPENNGGGVACVRSASILLSGSNFTENSATGNGGVMIVEESDVAIERSIFSNNTAGGSGGIFHTNFYPANYTVTLSSFIGNQAGGDGGAMFVGKADSRVTIHDSLLTFNRAHKRGGVIAITRGTLLINRSSILENIAQLGDVVSACNSSVTIASPGIQASQDPVYPFCSLYNDRDIALEASFSAQRSTDCEVIKTEAEASAVSIAALVFAIFAFLTLMFLVSVLLMILLKFFRMMEKKKGSEKPDDTCCSCFKFFVLIKPQEPGTI